jgi:hypothetical protein
MVRPFDLKVSFLDDSTGRRLLLLGELVEGIVELVVTRDRQADGVDRAAWDLRRARVARPRHGDETVRAMVAFLTNDVATVGPRHGL